MRNLRAESYEQSYAPFFLVSFWGGKGKEVFSAVNFRYRKTFWSLVHIFGRYSVGPLHDLEIEAFVNPGRLRQFLQG